jgi:hypothetical protein
MALVHDADGGETRQPIDQLSGRLKRLERDGPSPARIHFSGYLKAETSGTYQLTLRSQGRVRLRLHGRILLDQQIQSGGAEAFLAVGLESGWHPLEIELEPSGRRPTLRAVLAGQTVPELLSAANLAHDDPVAPPD